MLFHEMKQEKIFLECCFSALCCIVIIFTSNETQVFPGILWLLYVALRKVFGHRFAQISIMIIEIKGNKLEFCWLFFP